jgi:hypothetical protein
MGAGMSETEEDRLAHKQIIEQAREIEQLRERLNELEAINGGMKIVVDEAEARVKELEGVGDE